MSKKRLYICNNPYQIIVALMITKQVHRNGDSKDIIITDNFLSARKICTNIMMSKYFDNTFFAEINDILFPKKKLDSARKIKGGVNTSFFIKSIMQNEFLCSNYDEIYYNNDDLFLYNIILYCLKKNPQLKVFRFEEGYSSYIRPFSSPRAQKMFNIKYRICTFADFLSGMYFFYPNKTLFVTKTKTKKIEKKLDLEIKYIIKQIFQISESDYDLEGKWIIFEESFFQDYGYNADIEFYKKIIKKVGIDNVIIKLHPRSKINRFDNMGVHILNNHEIPWEAILLLNNFKNVKLITLASGSVINSRLMLGDSTEAYLLYKCITPSVPTLDENFEKFIMEFKNVFGEGVSIPENISEFYSMI